MAGRIRSFHSVPAGETHVLVRLHRETSTWGTASRQHPYIVASRRADRECRTQYTEHAQRKYRTSPFALRNASTSKPHTFSPALPPGTERRHHTCELVCDLGSRQLQTPQLLALPPEVSAACCFWAAVLVELFAFFALGTCKTFLYHDVQGRGQDVEHLAVQSEDLPVHHDINRSIEEEFNSPDRMSLRQWMIDMGAVV